MTPGVARDWPAIAVRLPDLPMTGRAARVAAVALGPTQPRLWVKLRGHEKVWAQVAADGQTVFSGALYPRQPKLIEASERVSILVGSAGALDIELNGKRIGPIGPLKKICMVELTAAGFSVSD
jgi:hypothetical protein